MTSSDKPGPAGDGGADRARAEVGAAAAGTGPSVIHLGGACSSSGDGIASTYILEGAAALASVKGFGPFLEAFATKLGEALGESTAAAFGRLKPHKWRRPGHATVTAELPDRGEVTVVLSPDTPDEARLALLDLDLTAAALRGKTLCWNPGSGMWLPEDAAHATEER